MSYEDFFGPQTKKTLRGNRKKSQSSGIFGESGNTSVEDMYRNFKANAQSARNSPAGKLIESKIKSYKRKRGIKRAKVKVFRDTLRTKKLKPRKIKRKRKDYFVY